MQVGSELKRNKNYIRYEVIKNNENVFYQKKNYKKIAKLSKNNLKTYPFNFTMCMLSINLKKCSEKPGVYLTVQLQLA